MLAQSAVHDSLLGCVTKPTEYADSRVQGLWTVYHRGGSRNLRRGVPLKECACGARQKFLCDHTHFCQTTPNLIKTRLRELYYEQITSLHARWIARRLYSSQTGLARQRWVSNTAGRVTKNQY